MRTPLIAAFIFSGIVAFPSGAQTNSAPPADGSGSGYPMGPGMMGRGMMGPGMMGSGYGQPPAPTSPGNSNAAPSDLQPYQTQGVSHIGNRVTVNMDLENFKLVPNTIVVRQGDEIPCT